MSKTAGDPVTSYMAPEVSLSVSKIIVFGRKDFSTKTFFTSTEFPVKNAPDTGDTNQEVGRYKSLFKFGLGKSLLTNLTAKCLESIISTLEIALHFQVLKEQSAILIVAPEGEQKVALIFTVLLQENGVQQMVKVMQKLPLASVADTAALQFSLHGAANPLFRVPKVRPVPS